MVLSHKSVYKEWRNQVLCKTEELSLFETSDADIQNRTESSGEKLAPHAHTKWTDDWEEKAEKGSVACSKYGHAIQWINYSSPGDPGHSKRIEERRSIHAR